MASNRVKGNKFQKEIKEWFEARGWCVYNKAVGGRYEKGRDIFGCDLIAKHHKHTLTFWIQATSDAAANMRRKLEPIEAVPWSRDQDVVMIIVKRENGLWAWYEYVPEKTFDKKYYQFGAYNPKTNSFTHTLEVDSTFAADVLNTLL